MKVDKLLIALDRAYGFPNKVRSTVIKRNQWYDTKTNEHVIAFEYRTKVKPGIQPPQKPVQRISDINQRQRVLPGQNLVQNIRFPLMREIVEYS